jgi:hypothetical protein
MHLVSLRKSGDTTTLSGNLNCQMMVFTTSNHDFTLTQPPLKHWSGSTTEYDGHFQIEKKTFNALPSLMVNNSPGLDG